jgi:hypothetical protein
MKKTSCVTKFLQIVYIVINCLGSFHASGQIWSYLDGASLPNKYTKPLASVYDYQQKHGIFITPGYACQHLSTPLGDFYFYSTFDKLVPHADLRQLVYFRSNGSINLQMADTNLLYAAKAPIVNGLVWYKESQIYFITKKSEAASSEIVHKDQQMSDARQTYYLYSYDIKTKKVSCDSLTYGMQDWPGVRTHYGTWRTEKGLYLYGGLARFSKEVKRYGDMWFFDYEEKKWTLLGGSSDQIETTNNCIWDLSSGCNFTYNDKLYSYGGYYYCKGRKQLSFNLLEYSKNVGWEAVTGSASGENIGGIYSEWHPQERAHAGYWHMDSLFFMYGGIGANSEASISYLNDFWQFNLISRKWTKLDNKYLHLNRETLQSDRTTIQTPGPRAPGVCFVSKRSLYLVGGYAITKAGPGFMNDIWRYDFKVESSDEQLKSVDSKNVSYNTLPDSRNGDLKPNRTTDDRIDLNARECMAKVYPTQFDKDLFIELQGKCSGEVICTLLSQAGDVLWKHKIQETSNLV